MRKALWATVAYWSANIALGYALLIAVAIGNPAIAQNQWEVIKYIASIRPAESPLALFVHLFGIVCPLAIGIAGLVALLRYGNRDGRRGSRPAPAAR